MTKKQVRNAVIVLALGLLGCFLPGIGPLEKSGVMVLLFFVAVLYGWSTGVSGWTGLVLTIMYCIATGNGFSELLRRCT